MCVYTETNGAYGRIGETLRLRLSLLLIDMDYDRIGEQFPCVLYSVILQRKIRFKIFAQQKIFERKIFVG